MPHILVTNDDGLWTVFPDLAFAVEVVVADGDTVWARWTLTGTDTGGMRGLPPTGRAVALDGADLIRAGDEGVAEVRGFFDAGAIPRQLGLQVVVQPDQIGPFRFGTASWVLRESAEPGAMGMTVLEATSPEAQEEVRERTRAILGGLMGEEGFLSAVVATVGRRMYTMSAWRSPEDAARIRLGAHADAAQWFFGGDAAEGGQTGVWTPHRLNGMWVRCAECGEMAPADGARCAAGHELPAAPAYW